MKKVITVILFLISIVDVSANPENFFNNLKKAKTSLEINSIINKSWIHSYVLKIDREIENNFRQEVHRFDYIYESKYKTFQINLITKNEEIIYGQILQFHWKNKVEREEEFVINEIELDELISSYNMIYSTTYESKVFIEELYDIIEYSFGCGYGVKSKEAKKILNWIRVNKEEKNDELVKQT